LPGDLPHGGSRTEVWWPESESHLQPSDQISGNHVSALSSGTPNVTHSSTSQDVYTTDSDLPGDLPHGGSRTGVWWPESESHHQPSAVPDQISGSLVSALFPGTSNVTHSSTSQDVYTTDLPGDLPNGESTFYDVGPTNGAGALAPAYSTQLSDIWRRLDEPQQVSIQCWIVDRTHRLTLLHHRTFTLSLRRRPVCPILPCILFFCVHLVQKL
jgi:hypothetical protein